MKPFLLLFLLGLYPLFGFAQTVGDPLVIELITDRETVVFRPGPCGFYDSNTDYSLAKTICGTAAWARTVQGDSIGCDLMPAQSLNGKVAIIRRGVCEGGTKMLYAERAGAVAAIVLNHYKNAGEDLCTAPAHPCCEFFFLRIPGFHASRYMSEIISAALDRGKASICLRRYRMTDAAGAYQGRTPVQQRDTLKHIQVRYSLDSVQNGFTSFTDGIIASAIYTVTGHERADELLYAPLENIIDPGQYALLKPRHFYYLSVYYMNEESDPGEPVFSAAVRAQFPAIRQWYAPVLYTSREGTKVHTGRTPFPVLHLLTSPDDHCFRKLLQTRLPHAPASLEVYPNPSDGAVSIILSDHLTEAVRLSVISSAGRVMRRQVLPFAPDGRHDLDLSALPSGVYFLMVHDEKGRLCARAPLVRLP